MKFPKFQENLCSDGRTIFSYGHPVGRIEGDILQRPTPKSVTLSHFDMNEKPIVGGR